MDIAGIDYGNGIAAAVIYLAVVVLLGGAMTFILRWLGGKVAYANAQKQSRVVTDAVTVAVDGLQIVILDRLTAQDGPLAEVKLAVDAVAERIGRLEVDQFGDNHGGLRETVNHINSAVTTTGLTVARLEGRLEEHLRMNSG